jgi:hypothetical protein
VIASSSVAEQAAVTARPTPGRLSRAVAEVERLRAIGGSRRERYLARRELDAAFDAAGTLTFEQLRDAWMLGVDHGLWLAALARRRRDR